MRYMAETVAAILALLAITCFSVSASPNPPSPAPAATSTDFLVVGFKCGLVDGKLVCGDKKGGGNKQGGGKEQSDDDGDSPKKSKDKVIPKTCGKKVNCDVGYIKLAKPNKYGACCEAPAQTKATEPAAPPQQQGGIQPVPPAEDTLLLPYFECNLDKPGGCEGLNPNR